MTEVIVILVLVLLLLEPSAAVNEEIRSFLVLALQSAQDAFSIRPGGTKRSFPELASTFRTLLGPLRACTPFE